MLAILLLPLLALLSLNSGGANLSIIQLWEGLSDTKASGYIVFWEFRLPRTLCAITAGSSLAVAGMQLQAWFRNPLAGPFVLGISSGASLGVALFLMFLPSSLMAMGGSIPAALMGSAVTLFLLIHLNRKIANRIHLLIAGIMISYLCSALITLFSYFSDAETLKKYVLWGLGSLGGVTFSQIPLYTIPIAIVIALSLFWASDLDHLLLGEEYAISTGLHLKYASWKLLLCASFLAAFTTAFCGPIGFIGLAVPHLVRLLAGNTNHSKLLPLAALWGANLCLLADILCQLPEGSLPLNAITSIVGAPFVIYFLWRKVR